MSETELQSPESGRARRSALLIALGTGLVIFSVGGALLLTLAPAGEGAADSGGAQIEAGDGPMRTPTRRAPPPAT
ncbi:MAG: hypothetical protein P8Z40_03085, partial [Chloroflexota bacterium]